jgi:crossover junction endodeoxyribonuclease RuvC
MKQSFLLRVLGEARLGFVVIILGIDPGFQVTGYGIVKKEGPKSYLIDCGYLKMSSSKTLSCRTGIFYDFFKNKIVDTCITDIALETPFLGKNAQNFLKLGYLRGIVYLLAHKHNITIKEFATCEVKQSVTGYGSATKDQVSRVVLQLFPGMEVPKKEDVTDALAVTLCGLWSHQNNFSS